MKLGRPGTDTVADLIKERDGEVLSVAASQSVSDAVPLMRDHDISQAPVFAEGHLVGVIDESNLLDHLLSGGEASIQVVNSQAFATAEQTTSLSAVAPQFKHNKVVLAMDGETVVGVIGQMILSAIATS